MNGEEVLQIESLLPVAQGLIFVKLGDWAELGRTWPPNLVQGSVKVPDLLTVGLLNRPRLESVARASARVVPQPNHLPGFDGIAALNIELIRIDRHQFWIKRERG